MAKKPCVGVHSSPAHRSQADDCVRIGVDVALQPLQLRLEHLPLLLQCLSTLASVTGHNLPQVNTDLALWLWLLEAGACLQLAAVGGSFTDLCLQEQELLLGLGSQLVPLCGVGDGLVVLGHEA